jgi:hypothetical protein
VNLCDDALAECEPAAERLVMVRHGPLSPSLTELDAASLEQWRTGEDISFVILARDIEGNDYFTPDQVFNVELVPYPETAARGAVRAPPLGSSRACANPVETPCWVFKSLLKPC